MPSRQSPDLLTWCATTARRHLAPQGQRFRHTAEVAHKAARVGHLLPPSEAHDLEAAALLHDIGYADDLAATGLHQIDGARWVASQGLPSIAGIIAHHSEADIELGLRGRGAMLIEFEVSDQRLLDALTYCDMTTGPDGETMGLDERIEEVGERRGRDSVVYAALTLARPRLELAIERTLMLMKRQEKVTAGSSLR